METELLRTVGQIAGIGGIALGVFLLLFRDIIRKKIFPTLTKQQGFQLLMLISVLVWSIALAGIGGIALGVFLLLYRDIIRKKIFPSLTKKQGFHLLMLIWILMKQLLTINNS